MEHTPTPRTRVVIIGAGFAGLSAAKALRKADVEIEIVDRRNYHLFQPLLYQVATADLSPADIAWPIRSIFSRQKNVTVTLSEVQDIDLTARQVITETGTISYDFLIVASGAHNFYFGNDWAEQAPGLKNLRDATSIRRRILLAFERAEVAATPEEQRRQLNFVVVGGGPTGVEMAGAIAELARFTLARDFRRIRPADARVILVEAGPRLPGRAIGQGQDLPRKARCRGLVRYPGRGHLARRRRHLGRRHPRRHHDLGRRRQGEERSGLARHRNRPQRPHRRRPRSDAPRPS